MLFDKRTAIITHMHKAKYTLYGHYALHTLSHRLNITHLLLKSGYLSISTTFVKGDRGPQKPTIVA